MTIVYFIFYLKFVKTHRNKKFFLFFQTNKKMNIVLNVVTLNYVINAQALEVEFIWRLLSMYENVIAFCIVDNIYVQNGFWRIFLVENTIVRKRKKEWEKKNFTPSRLRNLSWRKYRFLVLAQNEWRIIIYPSLPHTNNAQHIKSLC